MSIYGTPEYDAGQEIPVEKVRRPQAQPNTDGHVDSNPSPVMGTGGGGDDVPFLLQPQRAVPAQPGAGGHVDSNPSPDFNGRNHQVWLLDDDPGIAREDDPRYRLVKPDPNAPQGTNALIEYYIEKAIDAITNGDKDTALQMTSAVKTLVSSTMIMAKKGNNVVLIKKMEGYLETAEKIEKTL